MARLKYNNCATKLGASLTAGALSITFTAALTYNDGTQVPTITGVDYLPLSIDSGNTSFEVVYLTAYTAGATTGTIARGQDTTAQVAHNSGATVVDAPNVADFPSALLVANNLSDLASASAARTNMGLGTAAVISATAGGDLSGTLPAPTVAKLNGVTVTGTPSVGYVPTATSSSAATWQAAGASPTVNPGDMITRGSAGSDVALSVGSPGQVPRVPPAASYFAAYDGAHTGTTGSDVGLPTGNPAAFSVEGIFNWTASTASMGFWAWGDVSTAGIALYQTGATGISVSNPASGIASGGWTISAINNGANHHIVLTYNGTLFELWIDGVSQGTKAQSGSLNISLSHLYLASDASALNAFQGKSAYQAFYTQKLSNARIAAHYAAIAAGNFVNAVNADAPIRFFQNQEPAGATVAVDTGVAPVNLTYTAGVSLHSSGAPLPSSAIPTFSTVPGDASTNFAGGVDQTASRAIDGTTYTNNTGRRMRVGITATLTAAAGTASVVGLATAGGTSLTQFTMTQSIAGAATSTAWMFVDPGANYKATATNGTGASSVLGKWIEIAE